MAKPSEAETLFKSMIAKDKKNLNGYYELYRVYVGQRKIPGGGGDPEECDSE